ncbi:hypothetical protein AGABI2DRAFT_183594 [Agaricus bisporus var. bisporus H97]|uniref:hypothetical protein n=1 Tax=Agaricus bisporus var. bisporus (strain H97 / ATCC MYA-4626 / FGSC 10389) TaxID=936046 RepID=UPI00029F4FE7|nr:hypothetical protein AGABI2DRAFT_183594 [Agaricus bisporus var. bisporus H97]EKV50533.1 hypothetical protein AGABI2DRAFT_183594 [Agaricus bisporus var. bisporus H97]
MAHFEPARPAMRHKSSAQNILASFKPPSAAALPPAAVPAVPLQPPSSISSVSGMAIASALSAASQSSSPALPLVRADTTPDAQYPDNLLFGTTSPPLGSSTSVEFLRDLVQKRLVTLSYIRNVHEGKSHWFHTLLITRADLDREFNNESMKKRTYRFAILGFNLSNLLDINNPHDLLRAILNTITEHEQSKDESDRPKMKIFKKGISIKKGVGSEFAGSDDASYLTMLHTPFALDYHETVLSLLDVISEAYNRISKILGPSSIPHSASLGPLSGVTPYPGVSYLFASEANNYSSQYPTTNFANSSSHLLLHTSSPNPNHQQPVQFPSVTNSTTTLPVPSEPDNSLWSIANASSVGMGMGAGFSQPTVNWSSSQSDMIVKIDSKLKKIISLLLKDLDALARKGILDELASMYTSVD